MAETTLLWACWLLGCFWAGALMAAFVSGSLGFLGGFMFSGLLGRRDGKKVVDRLISDEARRLAAQLRREEVEAAVELTRRANEMAEEVLLAMEADRAAR